MKTCPSCGSVLADNEPYCENCGFDPDFDGGSWNYGSHNHSKKPYTPGKPIKVEPGVFGKELDSIIFIAVMIFIVVLFAIILL